MKHDNDCEQSWDRWDDEPTQPFEWLRTARVLVAEDDDALRDMIVTRLRADGCQVVEARDGDSALETITSIDGGSSDVRALDLVVIDVRMPGLSGLDVIRLLRSWRWTTPVLFVTAYPEPALLAQARELDARVLAKPFVLSRLSRVASDTLAGRPS
jgi:CheY-like chemotaxis protein